MRGLSHYRLLRTLGSGAQARVFLALDTRQQRRVCIKLYKIAPTRAGRRQAVAEAWKLTRIDSPRVLEVYDVVANDGVLALVTRYVPGCDLDMLLVDGRTLKASTAIAIVSDLAAALAALRRARTVHGDLKASNVLIDAEGRAYLADFGVAVFAGEAFYGHSLEAVSPEQYRGDAATLQSDFFALGLLLYRMLYGSHPFYRDEEFIASELLRGLKKTDEAALRRAVEVASAGDEDSTEKRAAAVQGLSRLLHVLLSATPGSRYESTYALREELRVLRAQLGTMEDLRQRVIAKGATAGPEDDLPVLPRELLRLPLRQHVGAWLKRYWERGSFGARAVLLATPVLPLLFAVLFAQRPGICVAVDLPVVYVRGESGDGLAGPIGIREDLTRALKKAAGDLVVLGAGAESDSSHVIRTDVVHDVCLAQRFLEFDLNCRSRCLLQLKLRSYEGTDVAQMFIVEPVTPSSLFSAVDLLLGDLVEGDILGD